MHSFFSFKGFQKLSALMAALFLIIHAAMFFIFRLCAVMPMAYINVFSTAFYCVMLILIYCGHLHAFVVSTFLEICVYMGLAETLVGWNSDFQITLIGICVLLFYAEYIGRSMHISYTPSIFLVPVALCAYFIPLVINNLRPAPYQLPESFAFFYRIAWAIIVFTIVLPILQYFVFIASRSQEELTKEVLHDKLTGLPNRYFMSDFFRKMSDDSRYWIAIADLDGFKAINDTYGHNCGDYILTSIATQIRNISPHITKCRWGGEEFLLAGENGTSDPHEVLESLRQSIASSHFQYEGTDIHLTVTIGAAWFVPGQSIDEWIDNADKKLYEGKTSGKNCVIL